MLIKRNMFYPFLMICMLLSCRKVFQYPIVAERINERIMTYQCLDVKVTAIKSEKGLIIIDTHLCPAIMSEIKKRIERDFGSSVYRYVINTHGHRDHASGNQVFPDSVLVGHEKCPQFMQRNSANQMTTLWYIRGRLTELRNKPDRTGDDETQIRVREIMVDDLENNYKVTPPTVLFADSLNLDAGDMTVKLFYGGNAHTNNDIIVYIPEVKAVFTGDLINSPGSYSFAMHKLNDIHRTVDVLKRVISDSAGIEYVIPCHTDIMNKDDLIGSMQLLEAEYEPFEHERSAVVLLKTLVENNGPSNAVQKYDEFKKQEESGYYFMEEEFMTYGMQLFWEADDSAAVSVFKIGLSEFPESALLCYNLANIYLYLGATDAAVRNYERSLEIFPENKTAADILKMIHKE